MKFRIYLRVLINRILRNNCIVDSVIKIVKFYYKTNEYNINKLKFTKNLPITCTDVKKELTFQSCTGDKIDCK